MSIADEIEGPLRADRARLRPLPRLLVTAADAAAMLAISTRHFEHLVAEGSLPAPLRLGRNTRWSVAALEAWTAQQNG